MNCSTRAAQAQQHAPQRGEIRGIIDHNRLSAEEHSTMAQNTGPQNKAAQAIIKAAQAAQAAQKAIAQAKATAQAARARKAQAQKPQAQKPPQAPQKPQAQRQASKVPEHVQKEVTLVQHHGHLFYTFVPAGRDLVTILKFKDYDLAQEVKVSREKAIKVYYELRAKDYLRIGAEAEIERYYE